MPTIIPRSEWGARKPKSAVTHHPSFYKGIVIHWFGKPVAATRHSGCPALLRQVQGYHMAPGGLGVPTGGSDIGYNYAVCPHGYCYQLRGWNQSGANGTTASNRDYIALVHMAGIGDPFTLNARKGMRDMIRWARSKGVGDVIKTHGSITGSECPGALVKEWMKNKSWEVRSGLYVDVVSTNWRLEDQRYDAAAVQKRIKGALSSGLPVRISKAAEPV